MDGYIRVPFKIGSSTYTYNFLVGDLTGVDCLLGLDWLMRVGAKINFRTMTAELGPIETIKLSTEPMDFNFVHVPVGKTINAKSHTKVRCLVTQWDSDTPIMFEPVCITFGDGLTLASGIVQPDDQGCFTITIQNDLEEPYELPDDLIIGHCVDIDLLQVDGISTSSTGVRPPIHCVWNIVDYSRDDDAEHGDADPYGPGEVPLASLRLAMSPEQRLNEQPPECHYREVNGLGTTSKVEPAMSRKVTDDGTRTLRESMRPPSRYRVYDLDGAEVSDEAYQDCTYYELMSGVHNSQEGSQHSGVSDAGSGRAKRITERLRRRLRERTGRAIGDALPEHLRCVLPKDDALNDEQLRAVVELILEFEDVFVGPDGKVGRTTLLDHAIDTGDADPVKCHLRKKSPMEREHITIKSAAAVEGGVL
mgnify:CR=1 FL=1